MTDYVFNEEKILEEIKDGIDKTYSSHYAQNKIQSTELLQMQDTEKDSV